MPTAPRAAILCLLTSLLLSPAARAYDFSVDPASPEAPSAADIFAATGDARLLEATDLGLVPGDNVDAFSTGRDQLDHVDAPFFYVSVAYSVDRGTVGHQGDGRPGGGAVRAQSTGNGAAGDKFYLKAFRAPGIGMFPFSRGLMSDAPWHSLSPLAPQSDLDGLSQPAGQTRPVFFSVDRAGAAGQPWGPADIIIKRPGEAPTLWASAAQLGLGAGDNIDALAISNRGSGDELDGGDLIYISLDRTSPGRIISGGQEAVIQIFPRDMQGNIRVVFDAEMLNLTDSGNEELNALTGFDPGPRGEPGIFIDPGEPTGCAVGSSGAVAIGDALGGDVFSYGPPAIVAGDARGSYRISVQDGSAVTELAFDCASGVLRPLGSPVPVVTPGTPLSDGGSVGDAPGAQPLSPGGGARPLAVATVLDESFRPVLVTGAPGSARLHALARAGDPTPDGPVTSIHGAAAARSGDVTCATWLDVGYPAVLAACRDERSGATSGVIPIATFETRVDDRPIVQCDHPTITEAADGVLHVLFPGVTAAGPGLLGATLTAGPDGFAPGPVEYVADAASARLDDGSAIAGFFAPITAAGDRIAAVVRTTAGEAAVAYFDGVWTRLDGVPLVERGRFRSLAASRDGAAWTRVGETGSALYHWSRRAPAPRLLLQTPAQVGADTLVDIELGRHALVDNVIVLAGFDASFQQRPYAIAVPEPLDLANGTPRAAWWSLETSTDPAIGGSDPAAVWSDPLPARYAALDGIGTASIDTGADLSAHLARLGSAVTRLDRMDLVLDVETGDAFLDGAGGSSLGDWTSSGTTVTPYEWVSSAGEFLGTQAGWAVVDVLGQPGHGLCTESFPVAGGCPALGGAYASPSGFDPATGRLHAAAMLEVPGLAPLWSRTGDVQLSEAPGCYDPDTDGICHGADNCPLAWNPLQTDSAGDGSGDACGCGDGDGDGLVTASDFVLQRQIAVGAAPPGLALASASLLETGLPGARSMAFTARIAQGLPVPPYTPACPAALLPH